MQDTAASQTGVAPLISRGNAWVLGAVLLALFGVGSIWEAWLAEAANADA